MYSDPSTTLADTPLRSSTTTLVPALSDSSRTSAMPVSAPSSTSSATRWTNAALFVW